MPALTNLERYPDTLILGGARSGKSRIALALGESILSRVQKDGVPVSRGLFLATAQALDQEMEERIQRHKQERGTVWDTIEEPVHISRVILENHTAGYGAILVDCLTLWLSNILSWQENEILDAMHDLSLSINKSHIPVILVSNEVGLGIVPGDRQSRRYRDLAGLLHQRLAKTCGSVIFVAAGIPMYLKGETHA